MPELFAPGLLREFAHIYLLKSAVLDAFRDPILLFLIQRKNRLSHKAALEDAALYQSLFQACMCLAGRLAAAIDSLADVIDAVTPCACPDLRILLLPGRSVPVRSLRSR